MEEKKTNLKIEKWQDRLAESNRYYDSEFNRMEYRERLYSGDHDIYMAPLTRKQREEKPVHVRNIIFENIESEISSNVPLPKVTARHKEDEKLAEIIEHYLCNERDRLPFERMNDEQERTVNIQGGTAFMVNWNNSEYTHDTVGELEVKSLHPRRMKPQPGVDCIEDMDWIIMAIPTTKEKVKRVYGKDIHAERESEPELRREEELSAEDTVTMYIGFERNEDNGINRYTWVNDVELEDLDDYQARRQPVCAQCGRVRPLRGQIVSNSVKRSNLLPDPTTGYFGGLIDDETVSKARAGRELAAGMAENFMTGAERPEGELMPEINVAAGEAPEEADRYTGGPCPWCGSEEWSSQTQDFEQVMLPMTTAGGVSIPGAEMGLDEFGQPALQPTLVPYYKPKGFPIILQKSVSQAGKLFGTSDVDVIEDQQNTTNRLNKKILDRIVKAGTRVTLPNNAALRVDPEDQETWYIGTPADKNLIDVYDFTGSLEYELTYREAIYQEARQILGITDSFQGRRDSTAVSGKAKEIAAQQSAGRLESKRVMKDAAYADIYQMMFQYLLAYSDEPRAVTYKDKDGNTQYQEFNRYDFLKQDDEGNYYWNDQFLFSVDTSTALNQNREAMWKETRENLQSGAFGAPQETQTLILFWTKMEELHYPGAHDTRKFLEEKLQAQQQAEQQAMQQQAMAQQQAMQQPQTQPSQQNGMGI